MSQQNKIDALFSAKSWFIEKHVSNLTHPLTEHVKKLVVISDYACRQIDILEALLQKD